MDFHFKSGQHGKCFRNFKSETMTKKPENDEEFFIKRLRKVNSCLWVTATVSNFFPIFLNFPVPIMCMELFFSLGKHLFGDSEAVFSRGSRVGLPLHGLGLCHCPRARPGKRGKHQQQPAALRGGTQQGQSGRRLQAQGRQTIQPTLVWQRHPCSPDPGAL